MWAAICMKIKYHLDPPVISTCEEFNLKIISLSGGRDYEFVNDSEVKTIIKN